MSRFARDGILERDAFKKDEIPSEDVEVSADGDVSVGDVGSGGTSSKEGDRGGRCELKDGRESENEGRREAREDFLFKDFICLYFSLSSTSLSFAESYSTSSPV